MQKLLIFKRVKKNLTKSTKINTWVISDGTKGMENQSLAVAKLLGYDYELINYNPPYLLRKIPLINKLNFHLVTGIKGLFMWHKKPYSEYSIGIDNIFANKKFLIS